MPKSPFEKDQDKKNEAEKSAKSADNPFAHQEKYRNPFENQSANQPEKTDIPAGSDVVTEGAKATEQNAPLKPTPEVKAEQKEAEENKDKKEENLELKTPTKAERTGVSDEEKKTSFGMNKEEAIQGPKSFAKSDEEKAKAKDVEKTAKSMFPGPVELKGETKQQFCERVLIEHRNIESDIPVNHPYWQVKNLPEK